MKAENEAVNITVSRSVYWAMKAVDVAVSGAVNIAVYWSVFMAVNEAVNNAVEDAVNRSVYEAVNDSVSQDPDHPSLDAFLEELT